MSVLLALVSNLAASRRGNEHVVTLDFVVADFVVFVCFRSVRSLQIKTCVEVGGQNAGITQPILGMIEIGPKNDAGKKNNLADVVQLMSAQRGM